MPSPAPSLLTKNIQNKPLEISVPSYEKEYQEMLEKQRIDQEARKKKKFTDALKEDIRRHGLLLLLGFVVLLIVYALRKERTPAKSVREQEQPPAPPEPPSGKDIWHEDF